MRQEAEAYIKLMDEKGVRHDDIVVLKSGKFDVETRWDLDETTVAVRAVFDDDRTYRSSSLFSPRSCKRGSLHRRS